MSPGGADGGASLSPVVVAAPGPLADGVVEDVALGPADGWATAQPITTQGHNGSRRLFTGGV